MEAPLYKILRAARWADADALGRVPEAPVDEQDGFLHLSDATQVRETARRHFAGQRELVLVTLDPARFAPDTLRWEPSRGGALFPHVYGAVPLEAVLRVDPLEARGDDFVFPDHVAVAGS
ncbi:MAG: DUF952 domain-containing protein [Sandaracinaceae bacterium]|nr:DUF952 domain-containing protein [Sandaracinaceae bacterium]